MPNRNCPTLPLAVLRRGLRLINNVRTRGHSARSEDHMKLIDLLCVAFVCFLEYAPKMSCRRS
jgi:hypothetical protein